ncbi:sugar kinase [Leucobacter sp. CSA1]|uniref:Sugar kinase n=1 Tax=Leucobacter chromiisoli TaxID=2796471 RepID=A0A934Q6P2_9MICO|nr:PfkB family carbohydrate kinase [Leucobacter chromiisoli]MBK0418688.1 sugar kinase [Leucobacter chromiisoli]
MPSAGRAAVPAARAGTSADRAGRPAGRRVVGFGDNVVDRFVDRGVLYPGGNCVNFAVFARRMGVESAYLGVFGTDDAAAHIRAALADLGVATDRCAVREGETGWCDVRVVDGDRIFGDWAGGVVLDRPFEPDPADLDYLAEFDLVHLGPYAALEGSLPALRERCPLVSFDLSDEPEQRDPAYLDAVAPHVDLAIVSAAELAWDEAERLARDVHARGAALCLVTRGVEGSGLFDGETLHRADAVRVEALDTMGAGDAFITAFALTLLDQGWARGLIPEAETINRALAAAAAFAAEQCSAEGAFGYAKEIVQ